MTEDSALEFGIDALMIALKLGLPVLLMGLIVGLLISIFQAITQIQEMTLTFIPKILAMIAVLVITGPWMLDQILSYTTSLYDQIPEVARK